MSSFKKLSKSDVSVVPYYANKQWNISIDCFPTSADYLTIYKGTNLTTPFVSSSDPTSQGQYERLIYAQINQLFYQEYTSSLDTSSLANSLYYESASQQRPTSSYFIYNDNSRLIKSFPTNANEGIRVIAINQNVYGNKVLPGSFTISSSAYFITDDGYGNLYDVGELATSSYFVNGYFNAENYFVSNSIPANLHIGNIYYAHGLAVITNQDYQLMFPTSSCAPTTSTTTTTTTAPTTTSTTSTTTTAPTTTTSTTSTTTTIPTTSTTTTTTTGPTTTSTTSTTTTSPTTSTTTTTTTGPTTTTTSTTTTTTTSTDTACLSGFVLEAGSFTTDLRITSTDVQLHPVNGANTQTSTATGTITVNPGSENLNLYYQLVNFNIVNQTGSFSMTVSGSQGQGVIYTVNEFKLRGLTPSVSGGFVTLAQTGSYKVTFPSTYEWIGSGGVDSSSYARIYIDNALCLTTSTTTTTTTAPTTSTTSTTTTTAPITTTTTTAAPTTSTTTTTTTVAPTTSTTTTTTTAAPTTSTTTSTTTAAPTTSTTTTTTTSAPPQNNFEYNYTRCSTGSTGTIIVSSALNVGDVYRSSPSGQSECYQIDSFIGTTSSSPTITLYSTVPDCSDINCVQA